MTKIEIIKSIVKNSPSQKTTVSIVLDILKEKYNIDISKRTLLTCFVKKTMFIIKKDRYSDILEYVDSPFLPDRYIDLLEEIDSPVNMEEIFFLFVINKKYVPSYQDFYNYCKNLNITFSFNWSNRNIFHSMKKKICNMLRDCKKLPE